MGRMPKDYKEWRVYDQTASISATATSDVETGWCDFTQLGVRLNVGGVTGGADTFDFKVQTKLGNDWVDIITMTQATAATSETKWILPTTSLGWSNQLRCVATVGAGATATVVDATVIGRMS